MKNQQIEILAPAGSYNAFLAAIAGGADAVYISGKKFGARAYVDNFTDEEIKKAVEYAHILNRKVYITINTLVYDDEFNLLEPYINYLYSIYVDAIIVQDLGVLALIKELHPDMIVHGSTQMSICNSNGLDNLRKLGVTRAILARETSLEEIKKMNKENMEIEVFIHGALCYSYSGHCLLSSRIGGRSGNRGRCAQPCRKKYSLLENNTLISKNLSLMSMVDLCIGEDIDKLILAGVTSLKIEGRMKSVEYIYNVVKMYRHLVDEFYTHEKLVIPPNELKNIKVTFNRGFTKGYLFNSNNKELTNTNSVNHQGILIGKVVKVKNRSVYIKLIDDLNFNDGIRFKGKKEQGLYVNEIYYQDKLVKNAEAGQTVIVKTNLLCDVNDQVYKIVDQSLQNECLNLIKKPIKQKEISFKLTLKLNEEMVLIASCDEGEIEIVGEKITMLANHPMDIERIKEQLSKLSDTSFIVKDILIDYDNKCFIPIKDLNDLRREAIKQISEQLTSLVNRNNLPIIFNEEVTKNHNIDFIASVTNEIQANVCYACGLQEVYNDAKYNQFKENNRKSGLCYTLNNSDVFNDMIAMPQMNIINEKALQIAKKMGFKDIILGNEISKDNLIDLSRNNDVSNVGVLIYGRMELMYTNQCFVAKEKGFDKKQCKSCLSNEYYLIDEDSHQYPLLFNYPHCQVRILDDKIINMQHHLEELIKLGYQKFLFVFTNETDEEIRKTIFTFQNIIKGKISYLENPLYYEGYFNKNLEEK